MHGFLPKKVKIKFIRSDLCGMLREQFRGYSGSESVQPTGIVHIVFILSDLWRNCIAKLLLLSKKFTLFLVSPIDGRTVV